jgi:uncharacterized protein (DUF111 family)
VTATPGVRRIPLERIIIAGAISEANVSLAAENGQMAVALAAALDHITALEIENEKLRQLTASLSRAVAECGRVKS